MHDDLDQIQIRNPGEIQDPTRGTGKYVENIRKQHAISIRIPQPSFSPPSTNINDSMASRKLKHHEKRLLKKVDFFQWKSDKNIREVQVLRRYLIQDREDYVK